MIFHEIFARSWLFFITLLLASLPSFAEPAAGATKVVYHLDDARNGRFALHIAEDHLSTNPDIQIAVVAYAAGVDFLIEGATDKSGTAYAPAVRALQERGVAFKVCSTTLRLRDLPKDRMLEGMQFVPSGTYEVIRLQAEDGFVYLKP